MTQLPAFLAAVLGTALTVEFLLLTGFLIIVILRRNLYTALEHVTTNDQHDQQR